MKHTKQQIFHVISTFKSIQQRKHVMRMLSKVNAEFAHKKKTGLKLNQVTMGD